MIERNERLEKENTGLQEEIMVLREAIGEAIHVRYEDEPAGLGCEDEMYNQDPLVIALKEADRIRNETFVSIV